MKAIKSIGIWSASQAWSVTNALARTFVNRRPNDAVDLGVQTISVGNVQAGGAGKTPLVRVVAQECIDRGFRVCILSRGYRGAWEKNPHALQPKENSSEVVVASECGDEVALLRELLPRVWFGVGANRIAAFHLAQSALPPGAKFDRVILDDGLQHWKIRRDLDLIAVTSDRPHERVFRESLSRLVRGYPSKALWIWTKGECSPFENLADVPDFEKSTCKARFRLKLPPGLLPGATVWSVCGIADPQRFHESLASLGLHVSRHFTFSDHHDYRRESLEEIFTLAKNAGAPLVTTGKDSVKWSELGFKEFSVLEPDLEWEWGRENWENALWR